ncbi:type I polyketide synthase [Paenibacillus tengchongensis]|uniref:type I polyketide synthase n=1 Tax=Paenibacillus tengchongensis TaxID=2608684 RepID=UPI00124EC396|nr:type I polyketide synthase [Paenibacillus tengchongensis]
MEKWLDIELDELTQSSDISISYSEPEKNEDIAIIGISATMPHSEDIYDFWNHLADGKSLIGPISTSRKRDLEKLMMWSDPGIDLKTVQYEKQAFLNRIDAFDYEFFEYSPQEARLMDPNQRLFLESAWSAIEDAGYGGQKLRGSRTGVFLGISQFMSDDYFRICSKAEPGMIASSMAGNLGAMIASRIAYHMDLTGPSLVIDTTCSSSLVAVHYACQALRNKECDMAITGGVKISLLPFSKGGKMGIESENGLTQTFDDASTGTGFGEGVISLLLKPLKEARSDCDSIYAIIKGTAVNHDGRTIGLTSPNPDAQAKVIEQALKQATIHPNTLSYIEAHGTGTKLGDPIEIEGIRRAFGKYTDRKQFIAVGSIKTNIGHLDNLAGGAGLLKAVLSLKNKVIPPSLNFNRPNSQIDFLNSPVFVNTKSLNWEVNGPRRCGVSSFGLSGTNCHVVLEECPEANDRKDEQGSRCQIICISSKSKEALCNLIRKYKRMLRYGAESNINYIGYTANTGRDHYQYRIALIVESYLDFKEKLEQLEINKIEEHGLNNIYYSWDKNLRRDESINEISAIANRVVKEVPEGNDRRTFLNSLGSLYCRGAMIDWDPLYKEHDRRRVNLPSYGFVKRRCWVPINVSSKDLNKDIYYINRWIEQKSHIFDQKQYSPSGLVLLFEDESGIGKEIAKELEARGEHVIKIGKGKAFSKLSDTQYISEDNGMSYLQLFNELKDKQISKLIHLRSISPNNESDPLTGLTKGLEHGVDNLFQLIKSLYSTNFLLSQSGDLNVYCISQYAYQVTESDTTVYPERAAYFGLAKAIGQENSKLKCKCIDVDSEFLVDQLINEIMLSDMKQSHVSYRNGIRYTQEMKQTSLDNFKRHDRKIKSEGVYLITGGLGGIGKELGMRMASENSPNIVLINRKEMPDRSEWDDICNDHKASDYVCDNIEVLLEMEQQGATVEAYAADVSNYKAMEQLINHLRSKYGNINGIIHCAGELRDNEFLFNKEFEDFSRVMEAKTRGTLILDLLTEKDDLDFFVLCSSISSIIIPPGQGDYISANAFLDSFAAYRNIKGKHCTSINWAAWDKTGMAAKIQDNENGLFKTLSASIAILGFTEIIGRDVQQVIVGEINKQALYLEPRMSFDFSEEIRRGIGPKNDQSATVGDSQKHGSVILTGKSLEADYTEIEQEIATIWCRLLGINEISVHDNFYDLGGNSLLSVAIEVEMEKLGFNIQFSDVETYPTISELGQYINRAYSLVEGI